MSSLRRHVDGLEVISNYVDDNKKINQYTELKRYFVDACLEITSTATASDKKQDWYVQMVDLCKLLKRFEHTNDVDFGPFIQTFSEKEQLARGFAPSENGNRGPLVVSLKNEIKELTKELKTLRALSGVVGELSDLKDILERITSINVKTPKVYIATFYLKDTVTGDRRKYQARLESEEDIDNARKVLTNKAMIQANATYKKLDSLVEVTQA